MSICEEMMPDQCGYFNARTIQGEAFLGQKHYEEAKRAFISGYNGRNEREQDLPGNQRQRLLVQAGERSVSLGE